MAVLHRKLDSIGAQKGIMISTGGYQSGAIEYAKEHGIALIIVKDYHFEFLSHSSDPNIVNENDPFLYAERIYSKSLMHLHNIPLIASQSIVQHAQFSPDFYLWWCHASGAWGFACKFCIKGSQSDPSAEKARFIAPAARNREGKTVVKGFYTVSAILYGYIYSYPCMKGLFQAPRRYCALHPPKRA